MAKSKKKTTRKYVVISLVVIILILIAGYLFVVNAEKTKLSSAKATLLNQKEQMKGYVEVNEIENCYRAEQGPFDNGKLWCSVGFTAEYLNDKDFESAVKSINTAELSETTGLICTVNDDTDNENQNFLITVRCASRSKKQHYPFTESGF